MNIGIDYDFPSMNMVCAKLEPLAYLCKQKEWFMIRVQAFISPSGKGWHVRMVLDTGNSSYEPLHRALELIGGDDPWRHVHSILRNEAQWETPLFEVKIKGKSPAGREQYHRAMSKRLREMFE